MHSSIFANFAITCSNNRSGHPRGPPGGPLGGRGLHRARLPGQGPRLRRRAGEGVPAKECSENMDWILVMNNLFVFGKFTELSQNLAAHTANLHTVFHVLKTFAKYWQLEHNTGNFCWSKILLLKNSFFEIVKHLDAFLLKKWGLNVAKVCTFCRSRQEFSNEHLPFSFYLQTRRRRRGAFPS